MGDCLAIAPGHAGSQTSVSNPWGSTKSVSIARHLFHFERRLCSSTDQVRAYGLHSHRVRGHRHHYRGQGCCACLSVGSRGRVAGYLPPFSWLAEYVESMRFDFLDWSRYVCTDVWMGSPPERGEIAGNNPICRTQPKEYNSGGRQTTTVCRLDSTIVDNTLGPNTLLGE